MIQGQSHDTGRPAVIGSERDVALWGFGQNIYLIIAHLKAIGAETRTVLVACFSTVKAPKSREVIFTEVSGRYKWKIKQVRYLC